jgi:hypothetical protein
MKNKIHIKSLALGAVLGALIVFTVAAASKRGGAAWEYRVMHQLEPGTEGTANSPPKPQSQSFEQRINAAAVEGWEATGYAGESVLLRRAKK